ncbi:MAG: UDP-N-acetylmuramate--L-alanine ligase [Gammaproteobacteria bacterium]|nr:MAG: UDP-N-acetylmuramate--L-alanine ligase [Gammaproteobacteria bacterium]
MRNQVDRVHFVGIGGVGMCGIAEVLANLKYKVSGSDQGENANTKRLRELGVNVHIGHDPSLVEGVDVVVISSAVNKENPEVAAALEKKIPVIPRAEMLGELMRFQKGIAVAGTHGKTTTTSLLASVLAEGGLDPTFVIGGRLNSAGANARLGKGEYLVAEADESDASFLHLHPVMAIVTNIDFDHMSTYGGDFERLKQTFVAFLHNLPFYGLAVMCIDDESVREIIQQVHKPLLTYGFSDDADVQGREVRQKAGRMFFKVSVPGIRDWLGVTLNSPGRHNTLNALAAISVAYSLDIDPAKIAAGLEKFQGIGRRFQINGSVHIDSGDVLFIDDYAHHPTELRATIEAAKEGWPDRRLVVAFQPHRYTRTQDLFDDFSTVLADLDQLVVTDVYAAGERPISGASGRDLCQAIRARGRCQPVFVSEIELLPQVLSDLVQANDLVLTMGAGNIGQIAAALPTNVEAKLI